MRDDPMTEIKSSTIASVDHDGVAMIGAQDVSEIAAEALAEIQRLRIHERASEKWLAELVPHPTLVMPQDWKAVMRAAPTIECDHQHQIVDATGAVYMGIKGWVRPELLPTLPPSEREQAEKTLVEAWGSPFAMNTENWK
jgi:hypothetical protein